MTLRTVFECRTVRSLFQTMNKRISIMEKAFEFLSSHKDVAFATVSRTNPKSGCSKS